MNFFRLMGDPVYPTDIVAKSLLYQTWNKNDYFTLNEVIPHRRWLINIEGPSHLIIMEFIKKIKDYSENVVILGSKKKSLDNLFALGKVKCVKLRQISDNNQMP